MSCSIDQQKASKKMVVETETLPKINGTNNGPRVSFNKDVHVRHVHDVKRYGSQLNHNDPLNYDSIPSRSQSPANLRRELPADLSDEALEREAALVLEQANYFGSLPHRKIHRKPIRRSISDASSKKSKRNSIFNIFNSTPTSTNSTSPSPVNAKKGTNEKHANNKKVERSKSDVSSRSSQNSKGDKRRERIQLNSNSFSNNSSDSSDNNQFPTSTPKKKAPLSPITEVNSPLSDVNSRTDYFDGLLDATNKSKLTNGENIKDFASRENLNLMPITDKMTSKYSKSLDAMHSSQLPAEKPALTKGVAVNNMIKRLSIERFSPPPQIIQAGGFSYTNPQLSPRSPPITLLETKHKSLSPPLTKSDKHPISSDIVYAQVVLRNVDGNETIQSKETVHNTLKKNRQSASPPPNIKSNHIADKIKIDSVDNSVVITASSPATGSNYQYRNSVKIVTDYDRDEIDNTAVTTGDEEPIIKPNIRYHPIPKYSSTTIVNNSYNNNNNNNNNNYQHNNIEFNHNEMRETDFNGDLSLSSRREILESRIKSRIGGLHINDNNTSTRRSSSSPPTTKRFHKYGSNEIINRYSPERTHLDLVQSTSPSNEQNHGKNYVDSTLRKKTHYYMKNTNDKGDSGIEVDNVSRNNRRNKYSSRFNIGRKWNYEDDIIECELFLMKEKRHTEETYPFQLVRTYVYRERSIDDGSHYDPNLDKMNIIKEWKRNDKITKDFLKTKKKKKSGIEKVKELFKSKSKSPNGVDDNEVKSRYREYSPVIEPPPLTSQQQDISSRRRMSTPTSSPVITSRSKSLPPKNVGKRMSQTSTITTASTLKRDKENNAQKFGWFTSLDRLGRKKTKEPPNATTSERKNSTISRTKSTSLKNVSNHSGSSKTLRFFGDTDGDDTVSKATSKRLSASQEARLKSTSMQNLNASRKVKQAKAISRSRAELQNISESTSDTEFNGNDGPNYRRPSSPNYLKTLPPPRPPKSSKLVSSVSTLPRPPRRKMFDDDDMDREFAHRDVPEAMPFYQKKDSFESDSLTNLSSARKLRESLSVSRENLQRDRFDSDASQRSIVFLHATTVGDIPSQTLGRSRTAKNSIKSAIQEEQPMTRTVNRSVSLNAPWKPKFISDGYEINYNNEQQMKGKYHQNQLRSKSASREKLTEQSRSRNERRWDRDSSKRI